MRRIFRGLQRATRHAVITAGVATLLAVGTAIVATAYTYALTRAVVVYTNDDDDDEQPRRRARPS